jgi:MFS family permease
MLISNIGTWMQNVAQPWLAYQITDNAFKISLVSALQFTPTLLLSLFAGAIIELSDKKKMLFVTQIVLMMTTLMFAVLVFANVIQYWHILLLATLMGTANAFDRPLRQSMVIELVPKEDLMNAIALNSTGFNLARIIGPSFAGIILGLYGVGTCFLINSLSFLSVIISSFSYS